MTQAEKDKIIKELQEKLAEAEKIKVDEPKRWKPNKYKTYWLVDNCGGVGEVTWQNGDYDKWHYVTGNCFKTKEEAEEHRKQIEYTARYKNYIEEHSEPIDWKNAKTLKYYAYMRIETQEIEVDNYDRYKIQGTIFASNGQVIWDAIKEIGEDNFKKYVLGVK
ncbi:MAG: hypothetical protein J6S85_13570 [Methanobrevibacter sp.]|nr:hypothetical protein [Methanobrevibacter sp.]